MPNGLDFERQVHALLKKMGFEAEVTKASGDGGIDIIAHSKEHITGGKYIIQCKDWSKPVGEPPVRDLYGVVTAESANKGILITTSSFTTPAIKFAEGKPLELIDGTKFNQLLSKYGLAGIEGESHPAPDYERIKNLTDKLNKNPKNIFAIKELADIYLLKDNYEEAISLYERLVPLKPQVETERLSAVYWAGINNYGVTLACLKRYDEAIKIFRQYNPVLFVSNEAKLVHYLELYDVATSLYGELSSISDNNEDYDEIIEKAYLQSQLDFPSLIVLGNNELIQKLLETAPQKAEQEGNKAIYQGLIEAYSGIRKDANVFSINIVRRAMANLMNQDSDVETSLYKLIEIKDKSSSAIAKYGYVAGIVANNPLQECYKKIALYQLEDLTLIHNGISKHFDLIKTLDANDDHIDQLMNEFGKYDKTGTRLHVLYRQLNTEFKNVETKWEEIINKEKTVWREKHRNTLYANWSAKNIKEYINTRSNKKCFIATAVYDSSFSPEVETLRQWRDNSLSNIPIGRSLISTYYKYSPRIADYIKHRPVIKGAIKKALNGVVWMVRRKER